MAITKVLSISLNSQTMLQERIVEISHRIHLKTTCNLMINSSNQTSKVIPLFQAKMRL